MAQSIKQKNIKRFNGDKKVSLSILGHHERRLIEFLIPKIPKKLESYHLTLLTLLWSALVILFSFFSRKNLDWLWGVSLMIVFQYFSDSLDGALGKYRKMGLAKWGHYMDHFLDYVFICSVLIGYSFITPRNFDFYLFCILAIFGGYMVNSYLSFSITNQFRITYFKVGPTEIRILLIIINTLLIIFGKTYLGGALPFVLIASLAGLIVVVWRTQRKIWQMREKE
ncbi:MAG: hypothetical protein GF332_01705 [Candidatus Moranbacteria bacterium]|nr:hypothetical protein [Candidatus Moranbacteria bacterium]